MELADLTAPTVTETIGGLDYVFTPLTWQDISELQKLMVACRTPPIERTKNRLDGLSEALQMRLMELAFAAEEELEKLAAYEVEGWQSTREGRSRAWWLMLRHEHADMTLSRADTLTRIADAEQVAEKQRLRDLAEKEANEYLKGVIQSKIDKLVEEGIQKRLAEMNGASAKKNSSAKEKDQPNTTAPTTTSS